MIELTHDGVIIGIISIAMSLMSTLVRSATIDKEKFREQKEQIKEHQMKIKEAQKNKDLKTMKKSQQHLSELMMDQMKHSFKPMLYTMVPFLIVFGWLRNNYAQVGMVVTFPYMLPIIGDGLGWLGWYIFCSMIVSMILNKALKLT
ncbi:MAG: EMC3/TMCO1 family protein [Candidatus Altiarchaeota archaeon]